MKNNRFLTPLMDEQSYHAALQESKKVLSMIRKHFLVVGILGLEPRMTGPESVVLPLHHIPKSNTVVADLRLQNYYFFLITQ